VANQITHSPEVVVLPSTLQHGQQLVLCNQNQMVPISHTSITTVNLPVSQWSSEMVTAYFKSIPDLSDIAYFSRKLFKWKIFAPSY